MINKICIQYVFGCLTKHCKEFKFLKELILVTSKLNFALKFYLLHFQISSLKTKNTSLYEQYYEIGFLNL